MDTYIYIYFPQAGQEITGKSLFFLIFIRPFEKRMYYAMAMSVRLSVRQSFPDFL